MSCYLENNNLRIVRKQSTKCSLGVSRLSSDSSDKLEETLGILREKGAILAAVAYCFSLFDHSNISKLTHEERNQLTILIRKKMIEASIATGERLTQNDQPRTLQ